VRQLIAKKADVNAPQPDGATALHWAAFRDDLALTTLLVGAGADANARNDYGVTPLSLAASQASPAVVTALLKAGADAAATLPSGETPLMTAAHAGKAGTIGVLLEHKATVDAKERAKGQTALMWAVSAGHLDAARALLDGGADANAASASGFTPLMFAARAGVPALADLLLVRGARINAAAGDGATALHVAVVRGHVDLALFLLARGADPNADGNGFTPLHWASGRFEGQMTFDYSTKGEGEWAALVGVPPARRVELVQALLAHKANPNARLTKNPPRFGTNLWMKKLVGATPFLLAAQSADLPVMKALLAGGADPMLNTEEQASPLMFAAGFGRVPGESRVTEEAALEAVEFCRQLGMDVRQAEAGGDTALHAIAFYGWVKVGQWLLDHGADINARNKKGETALRVSQGTVVANMLHTEPKVEEMLRKNGAAD
ncbi:MAG: ankyrin repeat domain-containing protein, partial [Vicinamibacterales bacterium]